jgi:hypothetical protein
MVRIPCRITICEIVLGYFKITLKLIVWVGYCSLIHSFIPYFRLTLKLIVLGFAPSPDTNSRLVN